MIITWFNKTVAIDIKKMKTENRVYLTPYLYRKVSPWIWFEKLVVNQGNLYNLEVIQGEWWGEVKTYFDVKDRGLNSFVEQE